MSRQNILAELLRNVKIQDMAEGKCLVRVENLVIRVAVAPATWSICRRYQSQEELFEAVPVKFHEAPSCAPRRLCQHLWRLWLQVAAPEYDRSRISSSSRSPTSFTRIGS
jgi:hypothetical protein